LSLCPRHWNVWPFHHHPAGASALPWQPHGQRVAAEPRPGVLPLDHAPGGGFGSPRHPIDSGASCRPRHPAPSGREICLSSGTESVAWNDRLSV